MHVGKRILFYPDSVDTERSNDVTKQKDFKLHALMCVTGGYMGTYSLLRCTEGFGAAQTANLIYTVTSLMDGNLILFLLHLLGLFFYMAGIETYIFVIHKTAWNPQKWALITELCCIFVIGLLPKTHSQYLCLYAVCYMLAAQWSVFHGACGYTSATIFSTNNVKQFSLAIGNYFYDKEREQARKAEFFGFTLLFYHTGVALVFLFWHVFRQDSVWVCLIPVLTAAGIVYGIVNESKIEHGGNKNGYESLRE